jgi:hypothetical protein
MSDKPDNPAPGATPNLTVKDPSGALHVFSTAHQPPDFRMELLASLWQPAGIS